MPFTAVNFNQFPQPAPSRELGVRSATLEFLLPADVCMGALDLEIEYSRASSRPGQGPETATEDVHVQFGISDTPAARGVLIQITGDPAAPPRPTFTQFVGTLMGSVAVFPVRGFNLHVCVAIDFPHPYRPPNRAQPVDYDIRTLEWWNALGNEVAAIAQFSVPVNINIGMLPISATWPGTVSAAAGIANSAVISGNSSYLESAITFAGFPRLLTHEIFHAFVDAPGVLTHAPSGATPPQKNVDPDYPDYKPYEQGSIGEFGYDSRRDLHIRPDSSFAATGGARDLMTNWGAGILPTQSDLTDTWISPYNYERLASALYSGTMTLTPWMPKVKTLVISFAPDDTGSLAAATLLCADGACKPAPADGHRLELRAVDGNGRVLATGSARQPGRCMHAEAGHWQGSVAWPTGSANLEVWQGGNRTGRITPQVDSLEAQLRVTFTQERRNLARLEWRCSDAHRAMIRYTHDDGSSWIAVFSGAAEGSRVFDLDDLPGGESCQFELLTGGGMRTGTARSETFVVARKARKALILEEGQEPRGSLDGGCWSPDFGLAAPHDTIWRSAQGAELGRGYMLPIHGIPHGSHTISVEGPDGQGGLARTSFTLRGVKVHMAE
jgi:hypothetical protein